MKRRFLPMFSKGRVARNGVFSVGQSVIGVGTYFLVMRYVVVAAGLEGIGLWSLTMGFVALVRIMDLTGANGLVRMVAIHSEDEETQAVYIDTLTVFIISFYALLSLITYVPLRNAISSSVDTNSLPLVRDLLIWAMISMPLNVAGLAQLSAIDGVGRADIRSIVNILGFAAYGLLAIALLPSKGIMGLAYAQFAQYFLVLVLARASLVSRLAPLKLIPTQFSRSAATASLHYGLRLQASALPMTLFDPLIRILLGRWAGLEFLGIYDLTYKLAGNTRTLVQAGMNPLVPEFARLHRSDVASAISYHARISRGSIWGVALAFSLVVCISPLFSLFMFSHVSADFMFSVSVLSLGWGIASFGLATQLYARAVGFLRWSIAGQWALLVLGVGLLLLATSIGESVYAPIAVAVAVAVGHVVAFVGETRMLSLSPFGSGKEAVLSFLAPLGFVVFTLLVALIALVMMHYA